MNCILNNLKFKVNKVHFNLLNFRAQYVSNFLAVCRSPVASGFVFRKLSRSGDSFLKQLEIQQALLKSADYTSLCFPPYSVSKVGV